MKSRTIEDFYSSFSNQQEGNAVSHFTPDMAGDIGHFNVFDIADIYQEFKEKNKFTMPYDRRNYYKISLISGVNRAEYTDKVIDIPNDALLFATPKIPYHWIPQDLNQAGYFCIFTEEFMLKSKIGINLDDFPIFQPGSYPVFQISKDDALYLKAIFEKMQTELSSDYTYKYDLLRNYIIELIHYGQKLLPFPATSSRKNGATRISSLLTELLERQFPIVSADQRIGLRTAKQFAARLSVHINYLNRAVKQATGKTTTEIIGNRIAQEAKFLLKKTNWSVSEIAYCLGFEELSHFSGFFSKQTNLSPVAFRLYEKV